MFHKFDIVSYPGRWYEEILSPVNFHFLVVLARVNSLGE